MTSKTIGYNGVHNIFRQTYIYISQLYSQYKPLLLVNDHYPYYYMAILLYTYYIHSYIQYPIIYYYMAILWPALASL